LQGNPVRNTEFRELYHTPSAASVVALSFAGREGNTERSKTKSRGCRGRSVGSQGFAAFTKDSAISNLLSCCTYCSLSKFDTDAWEAI